jgi:hypothetical protein
MHLGVVLQKPGSPEKHALDALIDDDRVALVGPILAEVLLGFRRKDQADWVASRLHAAHYAELERSDWRTAADLGRDLAVNELARDNAQQFDSERIMVHNTSK